MDDYLRSRLMFANRNADVFSVSHNIFLSSFPIDSFRVFLRQYCLPNPSSHPTFDHLEVKNIYAILWFPYFAFVTKYFLEVYFLNMYIFEVYFFQVNVDTWKIVTNGV